MRPGAEKAEGEPGVKEFLASVGTTNPRSLETYLTILGSIRERATKPLLELSKPELRTLIGELKGMDSGPQYCSRLRSFYRFHERDDLVKLIPKMKAKDSPVGPDDILTVDELNAMLAHAPSKRDRALIVSLLETGGRIAEVLALNVEDLTRHENGGNDGNPWFRAWFRTVKVKGEQHYGYVREPASVAILDAWLKDYPSDVEVRPRPLFPSFASNADGGRLTPQGANLALKSVAVSAGISKNIHAHLYRHTACTMLLRKGVPEPMIKRLLGWSPNSRILSRYLHLVSADVEGALGLSGESEKPAVLLVPESDVPAMTELPFRENPQKAAERLRREMREEFRHDLENLLRQMEQRGGPNFYAKAPDEETLKRLLAEKKSFIIMDEGNSS